MVYYFWISRFFSYIGSEQFLIWVTGFYFEVLGLEIDVFDEHGCAKKVRLLWLKMHTKKICIGFSYWNLSYIYLAENNFQENVFHNFQCLGIENEMGKKNIFRQGKILF